MPAQRLITQAEYISLTDNIARMVQVLEAAIGDEDTPTTAAAYAAAVRNEITALAEPDEAKITIDLLTSARDMVTSVSNLARIAAYVAGLNSAMLSHLGSDLNAWLSAGGLRVHPLFRQGGNVSILPANVFPPVTILGSMAVTGSGAGTFTDGAAVATATYGGAQIELEVTGNPIGAAQIVATVACVTDSGATYDREETIPAESSVGTKIPLGTSADRVANITGITFTGGTNGDAFRVQTIEDRSL